MADGSESRWTNLSGNYNSTEPLLICWDNDQNILYGIGRDALFKYSIDTNSWVKQHTFCTAFDLYTVTIIVCEANTIYAYNTKGSITIFTTNNTKYQIVDDLIETGQGAQGILINNDFHIIGGGHEHYKHCKWNKINNTFEILHDLGEEMNIYGIKDFGFVRVNNKLLMFGAPHYSPMKMYFPNTGDDIHEYDINNNKWTKSGVKMPPKTSSFGLLCISVLNNQYVLLLGLHVYSNVIWIYSTRNKTFRESNIKYPWVGVCRVFAIHDKRKDEMVVFGYVRREWRLSQIEHHLFPPQYLIRIMGKFYLNEEIHLFKEYDPNVHWKIDVFDIIS